MDSFIFSEKFKKDRKKAQIRTAGRRLNLQSGESISIPSTDVEIFAQSIGSNIFLGMTEQKFSSKESERRDMGKPVRRESLAISPRLAKILINISGAKEGETVLDPFCGIGGVVQEAVLLGINCVGIDRDSSAILGARKNLSWLESNYTIKAKYELLNMNSLNIQDGQYDAIVGESSLGEILKRKLSKGQAQEYLESFQKNIIPLLIKFRKIKKPGARIAMTFPVFEEAQIDITNLLACTGLELVSLNGVDFKIVEKRPEQFVHRQIVVFV
jgi:tRNA G10  N-methylase Trm11